MASLQQSLAGLGACDLRRACIHEYAHWAAARHFGAAGFVTIVRSSTDASCYGGRFQMYGELDDGEWRIVALAGTVAECVVVHPDVEAGEVIDYIRNSPAALSDTYAQLARGFEDCDVKRCLSIVRANWHEIAKEAAERAADEAFESRC